MADRLNKQKKKCTISEEDTVAILEKYSPTTVLTLLQEIAQNPVEKLDWNYLVAKTATGISSAREYQMLWRHLAYSSPLSDDVEDGAQPLDDDSDLECELEAFPRPSAEATSEAAACVKVLVASGSTSESNLLNTIEAPLIINVPTRQQPNETSSENSQSSGTYITVPVRIQKQPMPTTPAEALDPSGLASGGMTARRKRKQWTLEEDEELKAAVRKCGEGNWTNILKEDYMAGRTASQLSQRWSILKKKDARLDGGSGDPRQSDVQQAARHAMSVALDGMKSREESNINSAVDTPSNVQQAARHAMSVALDGMKSREESNINSAVINSSARTTMAKPSFISTSSAKDQNHAQKRPVLKKSSSMGQLSSTEKSHVPPKSDKPDFIPDATARATAVAAGGRIATASDAVFLFKAAQSKNAVHIKSSPSGGLASAPFPAKAGAMRPAVPTAAKTVVVASSIGNKLPSKNEISPNKVLKLEAESNIQMDTKINPVSSPALSKILRDKATISVNKTENGQIAGDNKKISSPVLKTETKTTVEEKSESQVTKEKLQISRQQK